MRDLLHVRNDAGAHVASQQPNVVKEDRCRTGRMEHRGEFDSERYRPLRQTNPAKLCGSPVHSLLFGGSLLR